jgi:hypothetical protein
MIQHQPRLNNNNSGNNKFVDNGNIATTGYNDNGSTKMTARGSKCPRYVFFLPFFF